MPTLDTTVPSDADSGRQWFATTHWSVVLAAKQGDASEAAAALEKLCRTYWPPLYAYIRRDGHDATEAQDLTQEFFARLLARDYLQHLHHQEGKFRSFLLAYLKNFLSEQRRKAGAQKRGGGCVFVSLNEPIGEEGYLLEPVDELTPDQVFERRWAQAVLQTALDRLREEYAARGQAALFERLQDYQPREPGGRSYAQLGDELGMTEAAVKSAVQRMRQRHRELLREEIAQTVTRPEEIEEELRHFRAVLGRERAADPDVPDFLRNFRPFFVLYQTDGIAQRENQETHARHQALRGMRGAFAGVLAQGPVRPVRARWGARHDPRGKPGPSAGSADHSQPASSHRHRARRVRHWDRSATTISWTRLRGAAWASFTRPGKGSSDASWR